MADIEEVTNEQSSPVECLVAAKTPIGTLLSESLIMALAIAIISGAIAFPFFVPMVLWIYIPLAFIGVILTAGPLFILASKRTTQEANWCMCTSCSQ